MTALVATTVVVLYLLLPNFIFRGLFSFFLPIKQFERTTAQELAFASCATLIPLLFAVLLAYLFFPLSCADYQNIFSGLHSTEFFNQGDHLKKLFWPAAFRVIHQNLLLLPIYYIGVSCEAVALGWAGSQYAVFKHRHNTEWWFRIYDLLVSKFLFPNMSEFYLLFTPFLQYQKDVVLVDVMTDEDHLYRGKVGNYFVDKEGHLSGLFLVDAQRFRRRAFLDDQKANIQKPKSLYWDQVQGAKFYFPADKILNLNLAYDTQEAVQERAAKDKALREMEEVKATVRKLLETRRNQPPGKS
jgi:hypothetical protein